MIRPGFKRILAMRFRQYYPWVTSPDRVSELLPGRSGAFLGALGWLFGRESTILICSFTFAFLLSVFPFIVLLLTVTSHLPLEGLREIIFTALLYFFPVSQEWIVRNLEIYIRELGALQIVSMVLLAWAGSALFFALEAALESAYRVRKPRNFVGSQIRGTALVLGFGLVTLLAASVIQLVVWLAGDVLNLVDDPDQLFLMCFYSIGFLVLVGLLICAFYWLPNREAKMYHIFPEAVFAAVLVLLGDVIFRWLVPSMNLEEVYGPFFVSVSILLWGYTLGCIIVGSARLGANGFFLGSPARKNPKSAAAPPEELKTPHHL